MKILVTGTAGFIGYHVANRLIDRGDEVVGLDSINDYYDQRVKFGRLQSVGIIPSLKEGEKISYNQPLLSSIYSNYRFIKLNLEDQTSMMNLFETEQFDAICHLAAQAGVRYSLTNPDAYVTSNIVGFMHVLEGCRRHGVKNLSFASSSSVYGLNKELPFSTSHHTDHPISLYAASKKSNELMAHTYAHLYGIHCTGLRFFTVYGPWGRPDMALFLFTKAALEGKSIDVFNHGEMMRDFTYIDDVVEGVIRVVDNVAQPIVSDTISNTTNFPANRSSAPYKIYNIGNNRPVNLMDFIHAIEKKLGKTVKKNMMPIQAGDVPATYADVDDLVVDLGYQPSTSIQEGINQFIDWYIDFFQEMKD